MCRPPIVSLRRLRSRLARSPWGARLLAAWLVLALTFALTPCCELVGAALAAPVSASTDHGGHAPDASGGTHAPDGGDSCATWLDRSDAVPPKADDAKPFLTTGAVIALPAFRISAVVPLRAGPSMRFPDTSPTLLYLRLARLIL